MEETKDIDTDFERTQKIFELKREALVQGTFAGVNEDELDSLLASAGFPVKPFTSIAYNRLMEKKHLISEGRFNDVYIMFSGEFKEDPAFIKYSAKAREAGIYDIMSDLIPNWAENGRSVKKEYNEFKVAELGEDVEQAEKDEKQIEKLTELAKRYNVSPRFILWYLTQNSQELWGIGATVSVDI